MSARGMAARWTPRWGRLGSRRGVELGRGTPPDRGSPRCRAPAASTSRPGAGPLAGLTPDQIEDLLLRAVLDDLKVARWDPASISNRSKCELGQRLRRVTALPLRSVTGFLRISKGSYEYWRRRLADGGPDRDADIRQAIRDAFGASGTRAATARCMPGCAGPTCAVARSEYAR